MLQLGASLITVLLVLVNTIHAQQLDTGLCPNGATVGIDPMWRTVPHRFEIMAELVANDGITELSQAFSTLRDSVALSGKIAPILFYWNFATNEQFEVVTAIANNQLVTKCFRQVLVNGTSQTSVLQPNTVNIKPSILLGFDERNQNNTAWGISYVGSGTLRGIPTNIFSSCFYVKDIQATVSATYHVSDVTKFHAYLSRNESIILQIDVQIKNNVKAELYTFNVFRYTPNPGRREERQALETPAGVFCPERISTLPVPTNIPERVSTNAESFSPNFNGSIFSSHNLYDTEYQFTRFDAWFPGPRGGQFWLHFTEIHDFATGLSYRYNYLNRQCSVQNITQGLNDVVTETDNPNLLQISDPQHFFLLDDIIYQYTGEKRCRDRVWCHVWIGEKPLPNNTIQHREWYWASNFNGEPLPQPIPTKLVIKQYRDGIQLFAFEMTLFNYRRSPRTVFEIDFTLADCYRAMGPTQKYNIGVLSFTIANDKKYPVMKNLNYLRVHIWETLIFAMYVRPIRISNLIVDKDKDNDNIVVTFTLLDAPPATGPVEVPLKEASLDKVIERLTSAIDSSRLIFRAKNGIKQVMLRAVPKSLSVRHRSTEEKSISTGPRITGFWIGFTIGGLLIGAVGGFFVFQRLAKS